VGIQATQRTEQRGALRRQINRLTSLGYPYEIVLHFGKLSGNTHIKERKRLRLIWDIARTPGRDAEPRAPSARAEALVHLALLTFLLLSPPPCSQIRLRVRQSRSHC